MAAIGALRLAQLRRLSDNEVMATVAAIRQATTLARPDYHLAIHGREFGATTLEAYLLALREHLRRRDLRVFTYLRPPKLVPFWELVAPDDGATALYNEAKGAVWSFYLPGRAELRFAAYEAVAVELVPTATGWMRVEHWRWSR